jgi:hypothetical protein
MTSISTVTTVPFILPHKILIMVRSLQSRVGSSEVVHNSRSLGFNYGEWQVDPSTAELGQPKPCSWQVSTLDEPFKWTKYGLEHVTLRLAFM